MKKYITIALALILSGTIIAQQEAPPTEDTPVATQLPEMPDTTKVTQQEDMSIQTPDKTKIRVGKNEIFIIEDNGDTTRLQLGSKGMSIVEGEDGYTIDIIEMDDNDRRAEKDENKSKSTKFKPHYAGVELGINNFFNPDFTLHTGTFMNLNTAKSLNLNLNFLEYGIGLGTSYVGLVTGLGLEWSNYVFDANNSIIEDANGDIINLPDPYPNITKSKLMTTYLTAPLLLEFQIPAGKKRVHLSAGMIGGVKTGSRTKIKYQDGGKQKDIRKDDFSLSPFRYGATVRLGYRAINIYANYYFSPLFGESSNLEPIHPFSIGLTLIPF